MKAVIDTNVLVSGLLNPHGAPGHIVDGLRTGQLLPVVDDRILNEYVRVLRRPYFDRYFSKMDRDHLLDYLTHNSEYIVATVRCNNLPDPHDAPFLETALTAAVPLITGNQKHFPPDKVQNCKVYAPAEFIMLL